MNFTKSELDAVRTRANKWDGGENYAERDDKTDTMYY